MAYAPIALFIYNRPTHTRHTLEALMRCPEFDDSPIYIFCDGSKNPEDEVNVQGARETACEMVGARATFVKANSNKGLANSIIFGVSRLCSEYGRVIVVEDDLVVECTFLSYLNAALDKYADEEKVMQVSAHMFSVPEFQNKQEAFFLSFTTSWGWATWQRAWCHFDEMAMGWERISSDRVLRKRFDIDGVGHYSHMLRQQMAGEADSWAIRWYWSVFKLDGLILFPPISYVQNKGFDGSGTHGWRSAKAVLNKEIPPDAGLVNLPDEIAVNVEHFNRVKKVVKKLNRGFFNFFSLLRMLKAWL